MRSDLPVVILKLRDYPLHAGAIGIARSIGRLGADVHVLGERKTSPVARSRYVRSVAMQPDPGASLELLASWVGNHAPAGGLLVPVDDDAAIFVQQHAEVLRQAYVFPHLPDLLAECLIDKAALSTLAISAEVPSPSHVVPATHQQLDAFLATATFPVVVKRLRPGSLTRAGGIRSVEMAANADEVRALWSRHLIEGRPNCLLQEYIPGGPETVWMVNAYADSSSALLFAATGRKLRQSPPSTGATSLGICERNDQVIDLTARLVRHIGYRGILDVGWRFDVRDGRYKLLDFNPRIGATFRLFVGTHGMDVLRACYLDMTGQPVESDEVPDGRKWINEAYDAFSAAQSIARGTLTGFDYLRSCRNVSEGTWWAPDDVAPALSMLTVGSSKLLKRGARSIRTPLRQPPARLDQAFEAT